MNLPRLALLAALALTPARAETPLGLPHSAPAENLERLDVEAIASAARSIDLAA